MSGLVKLQMIAAAKEVAAYQLATECTLSEAQRAVAMKAYEAISRLY